MQQKRKIESNSTKTGLCDTVNFAAVIIESKVELKINI